MLRVWVASGLARKSWASLSALVLMLVMAGTAVAAGAVTFYAGPRTKAPPKKLHGLKMTKFDPDTRELNIRVRSVDGPTGKIRFSHLATHDFVKYKLTGGEPTPGYWLTWSHHYHGDVYFVPPSVTIKLPAHTRAFYFYAEPNDQTNTARMPVPFSITATSGGTSSGPVKVYGNGGAKFFGFVAKRGSHLSTIAVTSTDRPTPTRGKHGKPGRDKQGRVQLHGGFAVGEFAIKAG